MAPTDRKVKSRTGAEKHEGLKGEKNMSAGTNIKKRKWIPEHKLGSIKEGQGFAFDKKHKVKHEYNKLLRKERKKKHEPNVLYKEEYPEHLKHLYLAEAEKLRSEAWTNRVNRRKMRTKEQHKEMEEAAPEEDDDDTAFTGGSETVSENPEPTTASDKQSLPISNRMKKRMQKKTSYQKTKEEFERIKEKRKKKKEEYLKSKQQREEAMQRYKQKKIETFRMLSKKTKKGQPNLNLQMEYLLQKIQGTDK